MTKHERIRAALAGKEVDHVPCGFWLHFPESEYYGGAAVDAHLRFAREVDTDLHKVMTEYLYSFEHPIDRPADWAGVRVLPVKGSDYQKQIEIVKAVTDGLHGEVPVIVTIHGVFASAFHGSKKPGETIGGPNAVTQHLRESPQSVRPALEAIAESLTGLCRAALDAGADGIYYAALGGEEYRFSRETFEEHLKPYDLKVLREVEKMTDLLVLHICKDRLRLEPYADYPGHVVNWAVHDCDVSLEAGRELFGRAILGGFDDRSGVLVDGTTLEIKSEAARIIRGFGKKGLVLGADCTLPTDIPLGNICAAVEAARSL